MWLMWLRVAVFSNPELASSSIVLIAGGEYTLDSPMVVTTLGTTIQPTALFTGPSYPLAGGSAPVRAFVGFVLLFCLVCCVENSSLLLLNRWC